MEEFPGKLVTESDAEFNKFMYDPNWVHIIGLVFRPGVQLFSVTLEYEHFPPKNPEVNDNFQFRLLNWQQLPWCLMSIPRSSFNAAEDVAERCGVVLKQGFPTMLGMSVEKFPFLKGNIQDPDKVIKRIFHLENVPGHPIYGANQEEQKRIHEEEKQKCVEIMKSHGDPLFQ